MTTNSQEDPPPYTPTLAAGESTLEHGPSRPGSSGWSRIQRRVDTQPTSLLRQLTNSFNNLVNQLDHPQQLQSQDAWTAYPGQHEASLRPSNPMHPRSSSSPPPPPVAAPSSSRSSSNFVRDFYAAGTAEGIIQPDFEPPTGPPRSIPNSAPDDARPTQYPAVGHPLLNDGRVLVFPRGYKCQKCMLAFVSHQSIPLIDFQVITLDIRRRIHHDHVNVVGINMPGPSLVLSLVPSLQPRATETSSVLYPSLFLRCHACQAALRVLLFHLSRLDPASPRE